MKDAIHIERRAVGQEHRQENLRRIKRPRAPHPGERLPAVGERIPERHPAGEPLVGDESIERRIKMQRVAKGEHEPRADRAGKQHRDRGDEHDRKQPWAGGGGCGHAVARKKREGEYDTSVVPFQP